MMKIQMLTNQPRPGAFPALPCYLAGQTYELATNSEVEMGKAFVKSGAAVRVSEPAADLPADEAPAPVAIAKQAPKPAKPKPKK